MDAVKQEYLAQYYFSAFNADIQLRKIKVVH